MRAVDLGELDRGSWVRLGVLAVLVLGAVVWWTSSDAVLVARGGEELDLIRDYSSIDELAVEATDVAVVEPTGRTWTEHIGTAPFAVTEVRVVTSDGGPLVADDVVAVRQDAGHYVNAAPVPEEGERYLVFLHPSGVEADGRQYGIVSAQAVWRLDGSSGRLTTPRSSLPRRVSVEGVEGRLVASSR
ncbi:hypothetical protein [Oerskovia sp. KBS0722]|uniref:hypothetical protein n=1 Tax=Oerskovia sp. KBS0722 TaxID=1179673 RepID=UPI00110DC0D4|nr:hypothetical protein [Oerskovia sp. KBS0722]QDW62342.1 hypothetical protein FFI11_007160 [Oerskovia sp. KBS0722]